MRLLIMGAPGSGKGTQAKGISERWSIPAISTGDIFRSNVQQRTPLGLEVERIMSEGGYVGDDVTNPIVADRLAQDDAREGFLLDGYPRTTAQVAALDAVLAEQQTSLDAVVVLAADPEELVRRLLKRATTDGRADDTEQAIRVRQDKYTAETAPLLEVYRDRGLLVEVDGLGTVEQVAERISTGLSVR